MKKKKKKKKKKTEANEVYQILRTKDCLCMRA